MMRLAKGIAFIVFAGLPAVALAGERDSGAFSVSASVPLVCEIDTDGLVLDDSQLQVSGSVFEMCNSGSGFRVLASHRALDPDEQIEFNYAGNTSTLNLSGVTEVAFRPGAKVGFAPVSITASGLVGAIAVSLAVTAV